MTTNTNAIEQALSALGLSFDVLSGPVGEFTDNWQKIAYNLAIKYHDHVIFETPYGLGIGYVKLPEPDSYHARYAPAMSGDEAQMLETWTRKPHADFKDKLLQAQVTAKLAKAQKVAPTLADVFYSLSMDSDVLDAGPFESWASDLGYNDDSMKAKRIYDTCITHALALRGAIGEDGLRALRDMFQDY